MLDLAEKTILVTGASKGIGASIIAALGREGAHVIGHYGSDEAGAKLATAGIPPERVKLLAADLAKPGEAARLWDEALAWRGRIDVLVNNAAIMAFEGGFEDSDAVWDKVWAETLQVNVKAPADLLRGAVRHYRQAGGGIHHHHLQLERPARLDQSRHHRLCRLQGRGHGLDQDHRAGLCQGEYPGLYRGARRGADAALGEFRGDPGRRSGGDGQPRHGRVGPARRYRRAGGLPGDRRAAGISAAPRSTSTARAM